MSTTPPSGNQPPKKPVQPTPAKPAKMAPSDAKFAYLLKSPFAKMFEKSGATPTIKAMKAIIDGIVKHQLVVMKQNDKEWKKAMKKMKDSIKGND